MVSERRNRMLQPWLWMLAGAALLGVLWFVVAVAPSLLIGPLPKGLSAADELKARNDVRATLVQALAGLAVAGGLAVTYRTYRQNRTEQDRTYERDLYAKAVEQLGHEKAPVRLGALYSLERLAEDKPERRQIIVDVICAYLRMPFSPTAPATKPEPETSEAPEVPAAETERRTEGTGGTWQQEKQVRLTAQHILTEHLRNDTNRHMRFTHSPNPQFWKHISLDLTGATLIDFWLPDGVVDGAEFGGATFTGDAGFSGANFTGYVRFDGANFTGYAWFGQANFTSNAGFGGAKFTRADFGEANFTGEAEFSRATFTDAAEFGEANFTGVVGFAEANFTDAARFGGAKFTVDAVFLGAKFTGDAEFGEAAFGLNAWFGQADFAGDAGFGGAKFTSGADFSWATFAGAAGFGGATFSGGESSLSFERSRVLSPEAEHTWPTGWCLGPDGSGGYTVVRADDGLDPGLKAEAPPAAGEQTS